MYSISLSTDRLRHLLREIDENNLDYRLHPARDVPGPGGGVYITAQTRLNAKVLDWIENRNPSPDSRPISRSCSCTRATSRRDRERRLSGGCRPV